MALGQSLYSSNRIHRYEYVSNGGRGEEENVSRIFSNLNNNFSSLNKSIDQFFFFNSQKKIPGSAQKKRSALILADSFVQAAANERVNQSEMTPRAITLLVKYLLTLIIDGINVTMNITLN